MKWKVVLSTVIGNALELYDFILYGFLATFIAQSFFPQQDEFTELLLAFGIVATACVVRPISALFFGKIGDTQGRRKSLLLSVNMMCVATFLVGVLPSYNSIGIMAAILLVLLRLIQGFSVSGEETSAAVYLAEESEKSKKGLMTSFVLASVHVGLLLGSIICTVISSIFTVEEMQAFGWRIPFLLALPLGILASYLRSKTKESVEFEEIKNSSVIIINPIATLFNQHKLVLIHAIGICCIFSITIYLFTIYFPNYLQRNFDYTSSFYLTTTGLFVLSILCPLFGHLSDKYGAVAILRISYLLMAILIVPIIFLLESVVFLNVVIAYLLIALFLAPQAGSLFAVLVELFPANIRCSGVSFAFNISFTLFGSSAPIIAHYLQNSNFGMQGISVYVILAVVISLSFLQSLTLIMRLNSQPFEEIRV